MAAMPATAVEVVKPSGFATLKPTGKAHLPFGWVALSLRLATACGLLGWQNHSLRKKSKYVGAAAPDDCVLDGFCTICNAQMNSKRLANTKVVQMVLPAKEGLSVAV